MIPLLYASVQEIKAFVILKEGAQVTVAELVAWSKENMADYKYPRLIEFRESLPMTATGKILKRNLKKSSQLKREMRGSFSRRSCCERSRKRPTRKEDDAITYHIGNEG